MCEHRSQDDIAVDAALISVALGATDADTLLWDVAQTRLRIDAVEQLWTERPDGLDWLNDYRCSIELDRLVTMLRDPAEEVQLEDEQFIKSMLVITGQDFAFDE